MRMLTVACLMLLAPGCSSKPEARSGAAHSVGAPRTLISEKGAVRATLECRPARPRLSDQVSLVLLLEYPDGTRLRPPVMADHLEGFLIRDVRHRAPRSEGGRVTIRQTCIVEPTTAEPHTVPSVLIEFRDAKGEHVLRTKPMTIPVTTLVDGVPESLADLSPAEDPLSLQPPSENGSRLLWIAGLSAAVVAAGLLIWRVRSAGPPPTPRAPVTPPEELALAAIHELQESGLATRDVRSFYLALSDIVRQHVEVTTGVRAEEQTTEEFLKEIRQRGLFPLFEYKCFRELLENADLVKYARLEPSPEQLGHSFTVAQECVRAVPVFVDAPAESLS